MSAALKRSIAAAVRALSITRDQRAKVQSRPIFRRPKPAPFVGRPRNRW